MDPKDWNRKITIGGKGVKNPFSHYQYDWQWNRWANNDGKPRTLREGIERVRAMRASMLDTDTPPSPRDWQLIKDLDQLEEDLLTGKYTRE